MLNNPDKYLAQYPGTVVKKLVKRRNMGAALYATMDALINFKSISELFPDVKAGQFKWTTMFKGIDYIYDKGKGIINEGEPAQIIVLNSKIIKVLKFGTNKESYMKNNIAKGKELFSRFGATKFKVKDDKLVTVIKYQNKYPVRLTYDFHNYRLWIEYYADGMYNKEKIKLEAEYWERPQKQQNDSLAWHINDILKNEKLSTKKSGQHFDVQKQTKILEDNLLFSTVNFKTELDDKGNLSRVGWYWNKYSTYTDIKTLANKDKLFVEISSNIKTDENPFNYKKEIELDKNDTAGKIEDKFTSFKNDLLKEYFKWIDDEEKVKKMVEQNDIEKSLSNFFGIQFSEWNLKIAKIMFGILPSRFHNPDEENKDENV